MATPEHLEILEQGVEAWNQWRSKNRSIRPDLMGADLTKSDLHGVDFIETDLRGVDLIETDLTRGWLTRANFQNVNLAGAHLARAILFQANLYTANLSRANLVAAELCGANLGSAELTTAELTTAVLVTADLNEADLTKANLTRAGLTKANLTGADLTKANLRGAILTKANLARATLAGADLSEAILSETAFGNTNLTDVRGLETCHHYSPSALDHHTLVQSGLLPLAFLRGCGLPEVLIEYLPSLLNDAIQYDSLFISYASRDHAFAERLYADLQNKGVRCWYAPEDMKIGDEFRSRIDTSIHFHDRLLLILSAHSIKSRWVQKEVETAFEKEAKENRLVLFPIRLDDAVMQLDVGWAADICRQRHIGDFIKWKEHDAYQKALGRLLRDLASAGKATGR
jgi:uncharacterized protein YjbI with pentapeptide repeats